MSVEVIGATEVFKTIESLEINELMARIPYFDVLKKEKNLNKMMESKRNSAVIQD